MSEAAEDIHAKNREGVEGQVTQLPRRPTPTMDLDHAYARYQSGKGFGRADLFKFIIDEVKALQGRIGAVDEAAVAALDKRLSSLETVIGNALRQSAEPHFDAAKILAAGERLLGGVSDEDIAAMIDTETVEPKRKPGRPSNAEIAAREEARS